MNVTRTPFPPSIWKRLPSRASTTKAGEKISPTLSPPSNAPAKPTDCTRAGWYNAIIASVARRAASTPIPPPVIAISSCSKNVNLRPWCSRSTRLQLSISPLTSRLRAATMASLGIAVGSKPLDGAAQSIVDWDFLPSQFALGFVGTGPHFLLSHANCFHRGARLPAEQATGESLIHSTGQISDKVRQFHGGRGQARDRTEFVQNLLPGQVLAAPNVALAALAFFQ